jgi:hypothetical protein
MAAQMRETQEFAGRNLEEGGEFLRVYLGVRVSGWL